MTYVCVHEECPVRELQVGLSLASTQNSNKEFVLARAVVDTGATTSCIDEDYVVKELRATPIDFTPTVVPGEHPPAVRGYFDVTVLVPEEVADDFTLPDSCRPGPVKRVLHVIGLRDLPGVAGTGTVLFLLGMDILSSLCFAFQKERLRSVFWLASPLDDQPEDLRATQVPPSGNQQA